jgi:hypothetical protein
MARYEITVLAENEQGQMVMMDRATFDANNTREAAIHYARLFSEIMKMERAVKEQTGRVTRFKAGDPAPQGWGDRPLSVAEAAHLNNRQAGWEATP